MATLGPLSFYDFFFYYALLFLLALHFSGYQLLLALIRAMRFRKLEEPGAPHTEPFIYVLVPTYNEERLIYEKLVSLQSLSYPKEKLQVIVSDGTSSDRTQAECERFRKDNPDFPVLFSVSPLRGKIGQLNHALELAEKDGLIVVTDADAVIHTPEALKISAFYLERNIGLVGGWSSPLPDGSCFGADHAFWDKLNRQRYMETVCFSSSIVAAPFYAFRSGLIERYPEDCVADDIYISFRAHLQQLRIVYTPRILVTELRQPKTLSELFRHKLRKSVAYQIELLRTLHLVAVMGKRLKLYYGFKLFQTFALPWVTFLFPLWFLRMLFAHKFLLVSGTCLLVLALTAAASMVMVPPPGLKRGGFQIVAAAPSLLVFCMMPFVLCVSFVQLLFFPQTSRYQRVGE